MSNLNKSDVMILFYNSPVINAHNLSGRERGREDDKRIFCYKFLPGIVGVEILHVGKTIKKRKTLILTRYGEII